MGIELVPTIDENVVDDAVFEHPMLEKGYRYNVRVHYTKWHYLGKLGEEIYDQQFSVLYGGQC